MSDPSTDPAARPVVAVLGLHLEASTFSPHRSTVDDFTVTTGEAVLRRYPWWTAGSPGQRVLRDAARWCGVLHATALPGGPVDAGTYEVWKKQILRGLRALADEHGAIDGVLLDLHGAMTADGYDDLEGDLARSVREVVGDAAMLSAAMDLHGNVSYELFSACDLLTCYRTAPHVDVWETRERAARNLLSCLQVRDRTGERPVRALIHVPILLPGEMTSTRDEPARGLYRHVAAVAAQEGVLDAAIWVGFAWADQPRCTAAVVVTGTDADAVEAAVGDLAGVLWEAREQFAFVAPALPLDEALDEAAARSLAGARPFFVSDTGDNPGAGGAGDVTVALAALLARSDVQTGRLRVVHVSICDPAAIAALASHQVGDAVRVRVGGVVDDRPPGPVELEATLEARAHDPAGGEVVSLRTGGLSAVVTQRRMQYHQRDSFALLGLDPVAADLDLVVVKMGYLEPDLHELAAGRLLALTPGGVDQDLPRLPYRRLQRPMFPLERNHPDQRHLYLAVSLLPEQNPPAHQEHLMTQHADESADPARITVAIPLYPRFTALDAVGPYEVLQRIPHIDVVFCAVEPGPISTENGMLTVQVDRAVADLPEPDVIVVPGGVGSREAMQDEALLDWVRSAHRTSRWTTSVCSGSLVLAAAGLLRGLSATSHFTVLDLLPAFDAEPVVDRVVTHPKQRIITAAGVSSGIDMALALVADLVDPVAAQAAQLLIEYDPQPPFDAGAPAKASEQVHARAQEYGARRD